MSGTLYSPFGLIEHASPDQTYTLWTNYMYSVTKRDNFIEQDIPGGRWLIVVLPSAAVGSQWTPALGQ